MAIKDKYVKKNKNIITLVIISDTHGLHHGLKKFGDMPKGDILIHAGDVSNVGELYDIERFVNWFASQSYEHKVFIAGNHDWGFEKDNYTSTSIVHEARAKGWDINYLEDSGGEIKGLKFWGTPVTSPFMNWAFNVETDKRIEHWNLIPDDTDILITHGPPYEILDFSRYGSENCGCPYLEAAVKNRIKPIVHIFGHIHGEYGVEEGMNTLFINASTLNERYIVTNKPVVVDVDVENKTATLVT